MPGAIITFRYGSFWLYRRNIVVAGVVGEDIAERVAERSEDGERVAPAGVVELERLGARDRVVADAAVDRVVAEAAVDHVGCCP